MDSARNHGFNDPDPWVALGLDQSTFFDAGAKEALLRGNASRSRQFLLPVVRPLARLSIVLVQLVRIVIPNGLTSSWLLHGLIVWGMKNFVQRDEATSSCPTSTSGARSCDSWPTKSGTSRSGRIRCIHHDRGSARQRLHPARSEHLQLIIQINAQLGDSGRKIDRMPLADIDFSAIQDIDRRLADMPRLGTTFLDLQTAIEIYTPLFALFLSDRDFWRSSNSLQLDETIALYVGADVRPQEIIGLVNNKHPMVPLSTMGAGFRLMLHGLAAENLYGFVKFMRDQQKFGAVAFSA